MAPRPTSLASVSTWNGKDRSGCASTGGFCKASFKASRLAWHSLVHSHSTPFLLRWLSGAARSANRGMNLWYQPASPRKRCRAFKSLGVGKSATACVLAGSTSTPLSETMWPRNLSSCLKKWHFFMLRLRFASCSLWKTAARSCMWLWREWEYTMMSSMYTKHIFPLKFPRTRSISLWKLAAAFRRPNGMDLNWNSPSDVINAVLGLLSFVIAICQYPDCKSNELNQEAPSNDSRMSCMMCIGYASGKVLAFTLL